MRIDFTEKEFAKLQEEARTLGVSLEEMAHDAIVNSDHQEVGRSEKVLALPGDDGQE
jgi:hypothetical protein